jgi:hypothetical protein
MTKKAAHVYEKRSAYAIAPDFKGKVTITPDAMPAAIPAGQTLGFQFVSFTHVNVGGTGNLKPGFLATASAAIAWPPGAGSAIFMLTGFGAAFVDQNDNISDHHFGDFLVQGRFDASDHNNVFCDFLLRDNSVDEGVNLWAEGWLLFFKPN